MSSTRSAIQDDLRASLLDSADIFSDEDWPRLVDTGLTHLSARRPRHGRCELTLVAGQHDYPAPADLMRVRAILWGVNHKAHMPAWEPGYPGRLPEASVIGGSGDRILVLTPAPTAAQIAVIGSSCPILYAASHVLTDNPAECTLSDELLSLLLLRSQAEAMRELSMHNVSRPAQMSDGMNQFPRNSTPGALYRELMSEFERRTQ